MSCGTSKKNFFIVVFWLSKTDLSLLELHTAIFMNEMICSLSVLQKCPTGVEAAVKKKQERPWVNCCCWVTDTWGVVTLSLSYRLDIFYNNQKKKRFLKSRWRPFPTERKTLLKQRRWVAAHCRQETANSSECWSTPFQSKQEVGGVQSEMRLGAR